MCKLSLHCHFYCPRMGHKINISVWHCMGTWFGPGDNTTCFTVLPVVMNAEAGIAIKTRRLLFTKSQLCEHPTAHVQITKKTYRKLANTCTTCRCIGLLRGKTARVLGQCHNPLPPPISSPPPFSHSEKCTDSMALVALLLQWETNQLRPSSCVHLNRAPLSHLAQAQQDPGINSDKYN